MLILYIFVLGLVVGSFLAALTYRWPKGISIAKGRSFCPHCKKTITWYDNIPLLSYLFLGGCCRNCHKKISKRYPIIEAATAAVFVLSFLGHLSILSYIIAVILIAIFVIDYEHQIIPDNLVFILMAISYLALFLTNSPDFYARLLTGFLSGLFLLSLNLITYGKGMGLGDVKLALFMGTFLGWPKTLTWFFLSFIIGAMVGVFLILINKAKFGKPIPFGPFLIIGFALSLFFPNLI